MNKNDHLTRPSEPNWSEVNRLLLQLEELVPPEHHDRYDEFCAALDRMREEVAQGKAPVRRTLEMSLDTLFVDFENAVFPLESGGAPRLTTDIYDVAHGALQPFCPEHSLEQELQVFRDMMPTRAGASERIKELRYRNRHLLDFLRMPEEGADGKQE